MRVRFETETFAVRRVSYNMLEIEVRLADGELASVVIDSSRSCEGIRVYSQDPTAEPNVAGDCILRPVDMATLRGDFEIAESVDYSDSDQLPF